MFFFFFSPSFPPTNLVFDCTCRITHQAQMTRVNGISSKFINEDSSQVSGNTIHLLQAGRYNSLNYSERVVLRLSWIKGLLDYDIDLQASASHFTHLKKKILKHFYKFGTFFCVQTKKKTNKKRFTTVLGVPETFTPILPHFKELINTPPITETLI